MAASAWATKPHERNTEWSVYLCGNVVVDSALPELRPTVERQEMSTSSESMRNADAAWSRVDVLMGAINVLVQMAQERLEADHALGRSLSPSGLIQLAGDFDRLYTLAVNVGGICTGICRPARQALQAELSALQGDTIS